MSISAESLNSASPHTSMRLVPQMGSSGYDQVDHAGKKHHISVSSFLAPLLVQILRKDSFGYTPFKRQLIWVDLI